MSTEVMALLQRQLRLDERAGAQDGQTWTLLLHCSSAADAFVVQGRMLRRGLQFFRWRSLSFYVLESDRHHAEKLTARVGAGQPPADVPRVVVVEAPNVRPPGRSISSGGPGGPISSGASGGPGGPGRPRPDMSRGARTRLNSELSEVAPLDHTIPDEVLALCGNADEALVLAHRLWDNSIPYVIVEEVEVRVPAADLTKARELLSGIWVKRPEVPKIPTARVVKRPASKD